MATPLGGAKIEMSKPALLTINIDGAARGNPGPGSFAYVIARDGQPLIEEAGYLDHVTNNVAEYTALVRALERAVELGGERLVIRSDSELLVKQMAGVYRVKNAQLAELYHQAKQLTARFDTVTIHHVRREANRRADELCNEILDKQENGGAAARRPARTRPAGSPAVDQVKEEAVACLRTVAAAWADGKPVVPSPEEVWDQLWTILEENGIVRSRSPK
jgi:ribonuclease HI